MHLDEVLIDGKAKIILTNNNDISARDNNAPCGSESEVNRERSKAVT
jgi:hypothetical protein